MPSSVAPRVLASLVLSEGLGLVPTFVVWFQLGEFRLFSVAGISTRGRGMLLLLDEGVGVFLEMRSGCVTWACRVNRYLT